MQCSFDECGETDIVGIRLAVAISVGWKHGILTQLASLRFGVSGRAKTWIALVFGEVALVLMCLWWFSRRWDDDPNRVVAALPRKAA